MPVIDTGNAPEIFADDLGEIKIIGNNVLWVGVRDIAHDQRLAVVKVSSGREWDNWSDSAESPWLIVPNT